MTSRDSYLPTVNHPRGSIRSIRIYAATRRLEEACITRRRVAILMSLLSIKARAQTSSAGASEPPFVSRNQCPGYAKPLRSGKSMGQIPHMHHRSKVVQTCIQVSRFPLFEARDRCRIALTLSSSEVVRSVHETHERAVGDRTNGLVHQRGARRAFSKGNDTTYRTTVSTLSMASLSVPASLIDSKDNQLCTDLDIESSAHVAEA